MAIKSAWRKGVEMYAEELRENLAEYGDLPATKANLFNGAANWSEYSYGGCSLIYDADIAGRLCTPSELKRNDFGRLKPNNRDTWLDVQARALYQASRIVLREAK